MTKTETDRTVHCVADGMTALGRVYTRGEDILIAADRYPETVDPSDGSSWLDLDADQQVARLGRQMFGQGPAPDALKRRLSDEGRQTPTRPRSTSDDPWVHALHREWAHEDRLRAQGGRVEIRSRTVAGPKP